MDRVLHSIQRFSEKKHTGHEIQKTRDPTWEEKKRNSPDDGEERSQSTVTPQIQKTASPD